MVSARCLNPWVEPLSYLLFWPFLWPKVLKFLELHYPLLRLGLGCETKLFSFVYQYWKRHLKIWSFIVKIPFKASWVAFICPNYVGKESEHDEQWLYKKDLTHKIAILEFDTWYLFPIIGKNSLALLIVGKSLKKYLGIDLPIANKLK